MNPKYARREQIGTDLDTLREDPCDTNETIDDSGDTVEVESGGNSHKIIGDLCESTRDLTEVSAEFPREVDAVSCVIPLVSMEDNMACHSESNPPGLPNSDIEVSESQKKKPKIYPCPKCKLLFAQYPSAIKHCAGERAIKSSACVNCNKMVSKINMKRHLLSCVKRKEKSSQEPTFKCPECSKSLSSRQRLTSHLSTVHHLEIGDNLSVVSGLVKCDKCEFSHISQNVVRGHMTRAHPTGIVFSCKKCEHQVYSLSGLNKHYQRVHNEPEAESSAAGSPNDETSSFNPSSGTNLTQPSCHFQQLH